MSRISENIRKITKAWGGKTTGNGISDALSDLCNNLPFGVKTEMVEIAPEQSVKGEHIENHCGILYSGEMNISLNGNTENLVVVINGVKYNATVTVQSSPFGDLYYIGNDYLLNEDSVDTKEPFMLCSSSDGFRADWRTELGETITLAIYEEKETVTPIDIKYLPIEELKKALGLGVSE